MGKAFKLPAEAIQPLVHGAGACFATDMITVDGFPVRWMYREKPNNPMDSGWRFMSGLESDEYMDQPSHFEVYDVNTIANYDPSIIPFLDAKVGSAFEKPRDHNTFVRANDWEPPIDE